MFPSPAIPTTTPHALALLPSKDALVAEFRGKFLKDLRTPAFVIDRAVFAKNCARMHENAVGWGAGFRAHLKTHKTAEGTRMQLVSSANKTHAVVVSTLMEAWQVHNTGLVADGTVNDILYGLPVAANKVADLSELWDKVATHGAVVRLLVDHPKQIEALEAFEGHRLNPRRWSVFVKIDGGQKRAGTEPGSPTFNALVQAIFASPSVSLFGFYAHAGNSYASTSLSEATSILSSEVQAVNDSARFALDIIARSPGAEATPPRFVLSVGSTPTAHSASAEARAQLQSLLHGTLELHAGNYPLLDLQQLHTNLIDRAHIAQKVLSTVISYYPGRGSGDTDEALCDAGGIAVSKDQGPIPGYGDVIGKPWRLGRISQEHGILTRITGDTAESKSASLEIGETVEIVGQHACFISAAYPWYYVTDSDADLGNDKVTDVWVPWKGW
ncbi:hypothetical protein FA95DRAFT_1532211 [Auriscalpium vulgare]|uniref:Uncharacterized protein n=1 Tax=Auriscalpium vulgare TaxID=40419 RepID=A0ACB8SAD0_9AGAM|nr:hypothetical protein FA95DRAFT_1532211 [Auriscalpium vulgare]